MNLLKALFLKKLHPNPAIDKLCRSIPDLDPQAAEMISKLSGLSEAYRDGGACLLEKALLIPIREYDGQYGTQLFDKMDAETKSRLLKTVTSLMLVAFFKELSSLFPEGPYPSSLSDALHFEIYGALPAKESFVDYLTYQNPNFDDPKMAPAYKFGNDIAAILQIPDLSFSFMVAQQAAVISDISKRLMRWVLFDEPLERACSPR